MALEPVEIDFIYGGNTQTEGPKIEKSMDDITNASKKAQAQAQAAVQEQVSVIKQIESDIKDIEKQLSKAAPGNAKMQLTQELEYAKRALEEEKGALNDVNASIENTAEKHVKLRTRVMEAKQALAEMEMAGKRGTPEYAAQAKILGELNDQYSDTATQAKILADDEKGFKGVASAVSGVTGAMSAGVGVAALFGVENEELTRIQTRLQAVMAITIGVQQVSEMLNKDSYFSVVILTKAKELWAAAELKLAASIGISTAAARASMIVLTGGLIVAVVAVVAAVSMMIDKQKEQKKAAEETAKAQQEAAKKTADDYGKEIAKVEALRASLDSENISRNAKLGIIKQLKEQIPGYTAELSKEGNVINENKKAIDEYMVSLDKSLKLRAAEKDLEAIYSKIYDKEKARYEAPKNESNFTKGLYKPKTAADNLSPEFKKITKDAGDAEIANLKAEADKIKSFISTNGLVDIIKPDKPTQSKEVYNAETEITKLILDINDKRNKLLLDQQTDSLQKRLDAIDLEKNEEIRKIEEKEAAIIDAYNKNHKGEKGFKAKTSVSQIDSVKGAELTTAKDNVTAAYGEKAVETTRQYGEEISKLVMDYAEERVKIEADYNEKILKLVQEGEMNAAENATRERDKRISEVTKGLIEETDLYKVASDDKLQASKETTDKLIADLKRRIDAEIAAGKLSLADGKKMLDEVNKAQKAAEGDKNQNNPFAQLSSAISANHTAGAALSAAKADPKTTTEDLAKLESASAAATASMAGAAGAALQGVQGILGSVVGGLDKLGMLTEEQKKDANDIMGMVGGAANLAMGIASGNPMQIIQGSVDLIVNGLSFFDFKTKALEKDQKKHLENVKSLEVAYKKLQRAVETALGTDVYRSQRDEIVNQKKQIQEYEAWLADEYQKKRKKQNKEKIAETQQKIEDLKNSIEDETKAIAEALAQTDAKSLASELADAITSAFTDGEDAALAFGDVAEKVMQNAVKNALKLQFLEKPMQSAVDQLAQDMESGGKLTDAEQSSFRKKIEDAGKVYYAQLAQYSDLFTSTSSASGIKGDIKNLTEETGSALTGQVIAMRLNIVALLNNSKNSLDKIGEVLAVLDAIKVNTQRLDRIDETLYYIKNNGIKVL